MGTGTRRSGKAAGGSSKGRLRLKAGGQEFASWPTIFSNPNLPNVDDYYEPWTYDF